MLAVITSIEVHLKEIITEEVPHCNDFIFKFPLFYQWQLLHNNKSSRERKGDIQWIHFSLIWRGLSNDKRVYSPQSIEHQSVHHSSLSPVDTSSFHIIWGGKSPVWLSWDWKATMAVLSVRTSQKTFHTISTHSEKGFEYLTPTFTLNRSSSGENLGDQDLHLAIWGKIKLRLNTGFWNQSFITKITVSLQL